MADDVNKSSKGVNGRIPKQIQEGFDERSRRIGHDYLSNDDRYSAMLDKEDKIQGAISDLNSLLKKSSPGAEQDMIIEQMQNSALLLDQTVNGMDQFELNNATKQNNILADRIKTYTNTRNVNQRTTTMSGEQRFLRMARESADLYAPTDVLESRIASGSKELNQIGSELAGRTRGLGLDDPSDQMMDKAARIQELQEEIALNKRLLKVQNKEGLSTEKRQYGAAETLGRVGGMLDANALRGEVASGKYGTLSDETEKLSDMFKRLNSALERFEEVSENATDAQGNLTKEYKDASAELDKMQKDTDRQRRVVDEVSRQYGGGGGTFGERLSESAGAAGRVIGAFGGMRVDDPISEMRLKAAAGQTGIDQYNQVNAGINGDMRSLLQQSTSQQFIKEFSDEIRSRQMFYSTGENLANSAGVVGGAADGAIKGFRAAGVKGAIAGAGVNAVAGASENARGYYQAGIGLPQTIKALEAYGAGKQFSGVGLEIQAQGLQALYDQQMGAYGGTMGLGGAAGAAESTLLDGGYLNSAAAAGLTPAQAASLTSMSAGALGGSEAATSVARRAGQIGQTRLMSAEQYIGMSGQLANVGGGTSDLEEIMKNAVAAGMDNAKNIQQMVSATVALSGNMAKLGISGTTAAGNLLGGMVQNLGGDRNIAALAAESMLGIRAGMDANSGINIGNVYEWKELRNLDPSMSKSELMRMSTLTPQEYQAIIEGGHDVAYKYGLDEVYARGGKELFKEGGKIAATGSAVNAGLGIWSDAQDLVAVRSGSGKLSASARAQASMAGLTEEGFFLGVGSTPNKGALTGSDMGVAGAMQVSQAQRQNQILQYGAGDNVNDTLKQLLVTMQDLAKHLSPEKAQARVESSMNDMKVAGPVVAAGQDFKTAAGEFSRGVAKFNEILSRTDMKEHSVNFNMVESTGGMKRGGK